MGLSLGPPTDEKQLKFLKKPRPDKSLEDPPIPKQQYRTPKIGPFNIPVLNPSFGPRRVKVYRVPEDKTYEPYIPQMPLRVPF